MGYNGLVTDLYQMTMTQGLFRIGRHQRKVVFDRFYRENPFGGGYTVVAGISHLVDFIRNFRYSDEDIDYLKSTDLFDADYLSYLRGFHFTGDIYAMPEGTVAFPGEVLLRFHGTTAEAMLLETGLSMIMNHESLIATKARRIRTVAPHDVIMEFGLRRAQGQSAGLWGARAAMIGGFNGTSNVEAGRKFGIPVLGTMAHSWVMSFDSELEAFREYARQYDNPILLADTYHALESGIPHAIETFRELRKEGRLPKVYGIRLDSGDLTYLSKEARRMFEEAGFPDAIIAGSNDLDEYTIQALKQQGCTVSSWGVGTKCITADGSPALGGVFKMCAQEKDTGGFEAKMKISDNVSKITNPGIKDVRRFYSKKTGKMITDLVSLREEQDPSGDYTFVTESARWRTKTLKSGSYEVKNMLQPVIRAGVPVSDKLPLREIAAYADRQIDGLWPEYIRLMNPDIMEVNLSANLQHLKNEIIEKNRGC